ncbi:hypothetical protein ACFU93_32880 [Streptomyces sp. NPDC057611]|uniref:hypothetical protein n=1 Tax=Streptomyces sp. NPDC057611 TaxID=3346182 RepID=UPI0036A6D9D8
MAKRLSAARSPVLVVGPEAEREGATAPVLLIYGGLALKISMPLPRVAVPARIQKLMFHHLFGPDTDDAETAWQQWLTGLLAGHP